MNQVITIPKKLAKKGELVVLPKGDYENMVRIIRKRNLDEDLKQAIKKYKTGNYYGPFDTAEEGRNFLKSQKSKHRK